MTRELGAPTRDAFGEALAELGAQNSRIVVVDADVTESTRTHTFMERFPERSWNTGIAESNLVGIGAGLAASGKIPVIASFACFLTCNAYDQIRMSIAFPNLNAKLVGSHGGISPGEDGPSQMAVEDVALMGALAGFTVIVPADASSTKALTRAMIEHVGPTYMRTGRPKAPVIYESEPKVTLGRAIEIRAGSDVTIIANGLMVAEALDAADELATQGLSARVLDMHTVKPIDAEAIVSAARDTKGIVVAEEHFAHGGLGSAVAMVVGAQAPTRMAFVNIGDTYSTSGQPDELFEAAGITSSDIGKAALSLMS
ncbi:MAG TPA: transketolase C-terminal domain-containing protein [Actinomycetota bacterium]|nr:transketolase C-terminal domain-containing protein [Actinomycetota bacterium]